MAPGWPAGVGGVAVAAAVALAARARAARRAERVARACHELRGPLSALSLGLSLASRTGALPPARVGAMEQELARAAQALDDLAGRGRAWFAADELQAEVLVGPLLADSIEAWRPAAAGRELRLETASAFGATVRGRRARLAQATGNLIQNAIEHGAGPVTVRARCTARSIRIEVLDGGGGLPLPIAQLLRSRSPCAWPLARRGRGHGLRIVEEIARTHGGRLTSAPSDQGARIVLELPLARRRQTGAGAGSW